MSSPALATQAAHTLTLLKDLDHYGYKKLHDGYLSDLALAIKSGVIGKREDLWRPLGLYRAWKSCNYFSLELDMGKRPWEKWKGAATPEYCEGFRQPRSGHGEFCLAYLYHFLVDISRDEVEKSIAELRGKTGWSFGKKEHLLTLAVQMPPEERVRVTNLSVASLEWSDERKWQGTIKTDADNNCFCGGERVWEDTTLSAGTCVLVIGSRQKL
jgi:hypothetical protein